MYVQMYVYKIIRQQLNDLLNIFYNMLKKKIFARWHKPFHNLISIDLTGEKNKTIMSWINVRPVSEQGYYSYLKKGIII